MFQIRRKPMEDLIDKIEEKFKEIGVKFYRDYKCYNQASIGFDRLDKEGVKNYVFYHSCEVTGEYDLDYGYHGVYLHHSLHKEMLKKVIKLVEENEDILLWNGHDHRSIFLTTDPKLMAEKLEEEPKKDGIRIMYSYT